MKKILPYAVLISSLFGCSAMTANPGGKLSRDLVEQDGPTDGTRADEMKKALTRSNTGLYGNYSIEATLLTGKYVAERVRARGKRNMDSATDIALAVAQEAAVVRGKTCFLLTLDLTNSNIEAAKLSSWVFKMRLPSGDLSALEMSERDRDAVPEIGKRLEGSSWWRVATLCGPQTDVLKGISLIAIPQFGGDDYAKKPIELRWDPAT